MLTQDQRDAVAAASAAIDSALANFNQVRDPVEQHRLIATDLVTLYATNRGLFSVVARPSLEATIAAASAAIAPWVPEEQRRAQIIHDEFPVLIAFRTTIEAVECASPLPSETPDKLARIARAFSHILSLPQ